MAQRVKVEGRFLCCCNYNKKDVNGNPTKEIVHQIKVFDGSDVTKISGVDGSQLKFGDNVSVSCDLYVNEFGTMFRAINE